MRQTLQTHKDRKNILLYKEDDLLLEIENLVVVLLLVVVLVVALVVGLQAYTTMVLMLTLSFL
jgi:hypothetical protein